MKYLIRTLAVVVLTLFAIRMLSPERTLVILSTNDIHGKIQRFPSLATAIGLCRDTVRDVLLVDAGDRWTGNAYVDKVAEHGRPVIELMNRLGYDVATLGNHEFDFGQAHLGAMLDSVIRFEVVCANVMSDTATFVRPAPWVIRQVGRLRVGVVGVVTHYEGNGYPAGNASSYVGLRFTDPQQAAIEAADALRDRVDLLVLLSHMGDDRDRELLARESRYDVVIGGHTHKLVDTLISTTPLAQTYKDLRNIGVTTIRLRGRTIRSIDYENIPITRYAPDSVMAAEVARYYADEELNRPIGSFRAEATQIGLGNWLVELMKQQSGAEVGFYHFGGVRLDHLAVGGVSTATVYDLEPFSSHMATMQMRVAEMAEMIRTKYNEPTREGGRYDLISTTPYRIRTDADGKAVEVVFPTLNPHRTYRVAISDYAFKNYHGLHYTEGGIEPHLITDLMIEALRTAPVTPDNTVYCTIE